MFAAITPALAFGGAAERTPVNLKKNTRVSKNFYLITN